MAKYKKGDSVIIRTGKDKGRRGVISKLVFKKGSRSLLTHVYVEGLNMIFKSKRPDPQKNEQGGILKQEAPISVSNIGHYNPASSKAERISFMFESQEKGLKKVRIFRSTGQKLDMV